MIIKHDIHSDQLYDILNNLIYKFTWCTIDSRTILIKSIVSLYLRQIYGYKEILLQCNQPFTTLHDMLLSLNNKQFKTIPTKLKTEIIYYANL